MYGLTECMRACYLPSDELDRRPHSVGIAIPGTEVHIVDENGDRVPPGTIGELVVRGPHVTAGYWQQSAETALRFRTGSLLGQKELWTGDLFRMDEDGFLYFVSRRDNIINTRGQKVSPVAVENTLCSMEGICQAAVVGVPDEVLGEAIKAVVVLQDAVALTEQEIRRYCTNHLDTVMRPVYLEIWPDLPRTSSGKIDVKELKETRRAG
jgi:acyl-CoA synthetase (AMP-forming)/AMP-acid ligase II